MKTSEIVKLLEQAYDQGYSMAHPDGDYNPENEKFKADRVTGIMWLVRKLTKDTENNDK